MNHLGDELKVGGLSLLGISTEYWAVFLGILAICVSVGLFLFQRKIRSLCYRIVTCTPLVDVKEDVGEDLELFFKGKKVDQVHLFEIELINNGNVDIKKQDFSHPITVTFGENAKTFSVEIVRTNPENLDVQVQNKDDSILIEPLLINKKESFLLKFFVTRFSKLSLDSRILGISKIKELNSITKQYRKRSWILVIFSYVGLGLLFLNMLSNWLPYEVVFPFIVLVGGCAIVSLYYRISAIRLG